MTLFLLRVGIDLSNAGFLSVIHPDNTYEFIHLHEEDIDLGEGSYLTYQDLKWNEKPVSQYVPEKKRSHRVHLDPEFVSFTYGSPEKIWRKKTDGLATEKNYTTLKNMQKGDYLVFYAAFRASDSQSYRKILGYYIFAYFVVDDVITYTNPSEIESENREKFALNHHYLQKWGNEKDGGQVIIKGNTKMSRVFKNAVLLSLETTDREGAQYLPSAMIQDLLDGYRKALNRSSIRKFEDKNVIESFLNHLKNESGGFISQNAENVHTRPNQS